MKILIVNLGFLFFSIYMFLEANKELKAAKKRYKHITGEDYK
jgi:hypothetical protein